MRLPVDRRKNHILPTPKLGACRCRHQIGIDLYHRASRFCLPRARGETMNETIPAINRRFREGTRVSTMPSYGDFD